MVCWCADFGPSFVVPASLRAADGGRRTSMEGVAGDRCALDGSPCVHAGRIVSGRYRRAKSAREPRDVVERGSAPGVWVPSRWLVDDWWRGLEKPPPRT